MCIRDRGIGIGSGYLFETTFQREATSDLTGERGSLMGAIQGLLLAQYEVCLLYTSPQPQPHPSPLIIFTIS